MQSLTTLAIKSLPLRSIQDCILLQDSLPISILPQLKSQVTLQRLYDEGYFFEEEMPNLFLLAIQNLDQHPFILWNYVSPNPNTNPPRWGDENPFHPDLVEDYVDRFGIHPKEGLKDLWIDFRRILLHPDEANRLDGLWFIWSLTPNRKYKLLFVPNHEHSFLHSADSIDQLLISLSWYFERRRDFKMRLDGVIQPTTHRPDAMMYLDLILTTLPDYTADVFIQKMEKNYIRINNKFQFAIGDLSVGSVMTIMGEYLYIIIRDPHGHFSKYTPRYYSMEEARKILPALCLPGNEWTVTSYGY